MPVLAGDTLGALMLAAALALAGAFLYTQRGPPGTLARAE